MRKPPPVNFDNFPTKDPSPELYFQMNEERAILEDVVSKVLTKRERIVFSRRKALFNEGVDAMREIARDLHISIEKADEIMDHAERKIAKHFKRIKSPLAVQFPLKTKTA